MRCGFTVIDCRRCDMENTKIKYRWADIGHWMARCNHDTDIIELNGKEFPNLSPLFQEYVWIHEHVHLLTDVYDETQCNKIVDDIFLMRASSKNNLKARQEFIQNSNSTMSYFKHNKGISRVTSYLAIVIALVLLFMIIKNK